MIFSEISTLMSKNMKMFFRSKVSASAVILIPLIVVILAGFAFDSSRLSNVNVGVYSDEYTEFTNSVIVDFEGQGFASTRYDTQDACINSVRLSESQICVLFPAGLNPDVNSEEIIFYADYSRVNLVSELVSQVQKSIGAKSGDISEGLAQELINSLQDVKDTLPSNAEKIDTALDDARDSKDVIENLEFPTQDIENAIQDLEELKEDVNVSAPSLVDDVDDIIGTLGNANDTSLDSSGNIDSIIGDQETLISSLTEASSSLDSLIIALNSQREINAESVVTPIKTRIETITADSNSKDFMIPIMLSLIAMFGSILLSSTMILREKKTKAFFRNYMAPVKNVLFILSTYLSCMFILLIQFGFIIIGIEWVLNMHIVPVLAPLTLVMFATLSVFVGLGMFIGYLFRTEETVIFSSMITASLLMFFSNAILPLENISTGLMKFLNYSPLVISSLAIKKIVLFRLSYSSIFIDVLILLGFFVVFFGLNCWLRKITRRVKQS